MRATEELTTAVRRFVDGEIHGNATGASLVAVSGGVDSMVLLHVLERVQGGNRCLVAHIHHGLRAASDAEEEFVRAYCERQGIALVVRHLHLQTAAAEGTGTERQARERRYEALVDIAHAHQATRVWLGHHADDQLETMLWRLARGTSLTGLAGMRPRTRREGLDWVRPLLPFPRVRIMEYADENAIPFVEDESNQDVRFTRNFIRKHVVPPLRQGHARVAEHAAELARVLQDEDDWLDEQAARAMHRIALVMAEGYRFEVSDFCRQPLPLQRRMIKIVLNCLAPEDWTMRHIDAIVQLAHAKEPSGHLHLPASIRARREYDRMCLERATPTFATSSYRVQWALAAGARMNNLIGGGGDWSFGCEPWRDGDALPASAWMAVVSGVDGLVVRSAQQGDRVALLGMSGTKKLQDVFTDAKVPQALRWNWPVVTDGTDTVVWVPGLARSRHYLAGGAQGQHWCLCANRDLHVTLL